VVLFKGEKWQSKIRRVQSAAAKLGGDLVVLNALDEAAWLFNLRSAEVAYTPVFRAYAIVPSRASGLDVSLYIPENKISESVINHLKDDEINVR